MDTKKYKIMKTIKYLSIALLIIFLTALNSCTKSACIGFNNDYCDTCVSYYPHKDTFSIGDTLWFKIKVPTIQHTECGDYEFDKDKIHIATLFGIGKRLDSLGYNSIELKQRFFKNGSVYENTELVNDYYAVLDKSKKFYLLEFGIILDDTGRIYVGGNFSHKYVDIDIYENFKIKKFYFNGGGVFAPFMETDSSYFSVLVKL